MNFSIQLFYFSVPEFLCFILVVSLCWYSHFIYILFSQFNLVVSLCCVYAYWPYLNQLIWILCQIIYRSLFPYDRFLEINFLPLFEPCFPVSSYASWLSKLRHLKKQLLLTVLSEQALYLGDHPKSVWIKILGRYVLFEPVCIRVICFFFRSLQSTALSCVCCTAGSWHSDIAKLPFAFHSPQPCREY